MRAFVHNPRLQPVGDYGLFQDYRFTSFFVTLRKRTD